MSIALSPMPFSDVREASAPRTSSAKAAEMSQQKCGETSPDAIAGFLRRQHPFKTAETVSFETGVSPETVRVWLRGGAPNLTGLLALIRVYGPDFLGALIPSAAWLDEARRAEQSRALRADIAALAARLGDFDHEGTATPAPNGNGGNGAFSGAVVAEARLRAGEVGR